MSAAATRALAVAVHDVEPATFERCVRMRDWLGERGVERATLLVIPARDLHPLAERSPGMVRWLLERERDGDSIAQHGFHHAPAQRGRPVRDRTIGLGGQAGEFAGLDEEQTRRVVEAGWRVLKLAGIHPHGFVAPGYVYTPALRTTLKRRFRWWAELFAVHHVALGPDSRRTLVPPPLAPASPTRVRGSLSRALARAEAHIQALMPQATLRLDLHPHDFDRPSRVAALERLLRAIVAGRRVITYDDLAIASASAGGYPAAKIEPLNGFASGEAAKPSLFNPNSCSTVASSEKWL